MTFIVTKFHSYVRANAVSARQKRLITENKVLVIIGGGNHLSANVHSASSVIDESTYKFSKINLMMGFLSFKKK